jgi:hypothetical protein
MKPGMPSRLGIRLLERLLPEKNREAVVGDLIEEAALRSLVVLEASHMFGSTRALVKIAAGALVRNSG